METARLTTADDLATIIAISEMFRNDLADKRGGKLFLLSEAREVKPRLISCIESDSGLAVTGLFEDIVFGYAICEFRSLQDSTKVAKLTDFVVDQQAREVGIGEAMMNLITKELLARDFSYIDSMALPGDRETKNFFESFGLKARKLIVSREL